jgi:SNF2 family DNA or RNA helicase
LRTVGAKQEWVEAVAGMLPDGVMSKDYQVAGAIFLATAKRAMLFDEQGTGKMTQTALTLSLYPDLKERPTLIISPKSVVWTWQRELAKFGIDSVVIDGQAAERRKQFDQFHKGDARVLIISYALVAKHSRVSGFGTIKLTDEHKTPKELNQTKWHTVVADEAHRLKDPDSVQTRACWAARDGAEYVWGLTGTPIESDILDMWALLHFIAPIEFPAKTKFLDMWVMTAPQFFGGLDVIGIRPDVEEEFRAITEWHWRRALADTDALPPREWDTRYCHMDAKGRKAYNDMKKQLMAELDSDGSFDTLFAENHMVKTGRLKQLASATCVIDDQDNVRMTEPSWKLDAVEDAMQDYPYPAIYWFDNRDLLHLFEARLAKQGIEYVSVHGDVVGRDRDDAVQRFQNGEVDHILVTYGAGSEGITLTRAKVAHRVQRPWSSIKDSQAPFRNWRIGSEGHDRVVFVDYLVVGTVEEELIARLGDKNEAIQEVLRDQR